MVSGRTALRGKMWLHITVAYTASGIGAMAKADSGMSAASRPIDRLIDVEVGGRCRLTDAVTEYCNYLDFFEAIPALPATCTVI